MLIRVLGSAAGGGFPQWNCACLNCRGVRAGTIVAAPRTETALAIRGPDGSWFLIHATADVRAQFRAFPPLHPKMGRESPLAGIVLTNGDLDQSLGLFTLREGQPLHLYTTPSVRRAVLEGNGFARLFDRIPGHLTWHELKLDVSQPLYGLQGPPSLFVTALPMPGKAPLYCDPGSFPQPDVNVGLLIRDPDSGRTLAYAPCVGRHSNEVDLLWAESDVLFFDGTFWGDDELPSQGLGRKTAGDMAHWPVGGPHGSLRHLASVQASRKILVHVNNTNPLLRDDSPERLEAQEAGVEVAFDGMEVTV